MVKACVGKKPPPPNPSPSPDPTESHDSEDRKTKPKVRTRSLARENKAVPRRLVLTLHSSRGLNTPMLVRHTRPGAHPKRHCSVIDSDSG